MFRIAKSKNLHEDYDTTSKVVFVIEDNNYVYSFHDYSKIENNFRDYVEALIETTKDSDFNWNIAIVGPSRKNELRNITVTITSYDADIDPKIVDECLRKGNERIKNYLAQLPKYRVFCTTASIDANSIKPIENSLTGNQTLMVINNLGYHTMIAVRSDIETKHLFNVSFLLSASAPKSDVLYLNFKEDDFNKKAVLYREFL